MASIKDVQLKSIVTGKGHDGGGFYANIYLKNKKIGTVLDDGWGGELQISLIKERETFFEICKEYHEEKNEDLLMPCDLLIYDLLKLNVLEKEFKAATKEGYFFVVHLDYRPRNKEGVARKDAAIPYPSEELFFCGNEEDVTELVIDKKPPQYEVYRSLTDFVV